MGDLLLLVLLAAGLWGLGLVGLLMGRVALLGIGRAFRAGRWPEAPGTILFSGVVPLPMPREPGAYEPPRTQAVVRYSYHVDGREYVGGRLRIGHGGGGRISEELRAQLYPAGLAVPVYYNPADPQESTLAVEADWVNLLTGLAAAAVLLAVSLGLGYLLVAMFGPWLALLGIGVIGAGLSFGLRDIVMEVLRALVSKPTPLSSAESPAATTGPEPAGPQG